MYITIGNEIDVETDLDAGIIQLIMDVEGYKPPVPAPACCNPSSPAFSDPGCGSEFDDVKFRLVVNGHIIDLPSEVNDKIYDALEVIIEKNLDEVMESKQEDWNV